MSLPRFFLEDQVLAHEMAGAFELRLSPDDVKHVRALRIDPGEHIMVIDADDDCFECEVVGFSEGLPLVSIARHEDARDEVPSITLVQGMAKGDKMDAVIRQATELGVRSFIPLRCERSVVRLDDKKAASRTERWRAIAKSAAMQSGQPCIPDVAMPCSLDEACERLARETVVLICWEEAPSASSLHAALSSSLAAESTGVHDARIAIVVGPEGGLSPIEVEKLLACSPHAHLVSLGPSILRTETAGVVAPALTLYELGCLGGA